MEDPVHAPFTMGQQPGKPTLTGCPRLSTPGRRMPAGGSPCRFATGQQALAGRTPTGGTVPERTPEEVLALVKDEGCEFVDLRFSDFKKFSVDSKVVFTGE